MTRYRKSFYWAALAGALSLFDLAIAQDGPGTDIDADEIRTIMKTDIDQLKRLPVTGLAMVKSGDRTFFMSENGRYAIVGQGLRLVDTWNGKILKTPDEAGMFADRIDLAKIGVNLADLNPLTYGTGKKQVIVFVDPECPYCKALTKQMPGLAKEYTFKLLPVAFLGQRSSDILRTLSCMEKQQAVDILVSGNYSELNTTGTGCNNPAQSVAAQKTLLLAKILGVQSIPFMLTHENVARRGAVKDLGLYLSKGVTGFEDSDKERAAAIKSLGEKPGKKGEKK